MFFAALSAARVLSAACFASSLSAACFASSLRTGKYACAPGLAFALRKHTKLAKQAGA